MFRMMRRLLRASTLAAVAFVSLAVAGFGPARAACYDPQQQLPAQTLADFKADPAQLLQQFPNAGPGLISRIRDLVASDQATLPLIIQLLSTANLTLTPDQVNALGIGLGQAALVCLRVDQAFATEIQNAVAAANNDPFAVAFAGVLGDRPIAALGGGAGGVSGGAGGGQTNPITGTGTFTGTPTFFGNTATQNTGTNFFTAPSVTAGGVTINNTTTTTTPVTPVSPTQ